MNTLPIILLIVVCVIAAAVWARSDYQRWIALGPGGLPQTFAGWFTMTRFRLLKRDPIHPAIYDLFDQANAAEPGYLAELPNRGGPRPKLAPWPIPHRQLDQFASTLHQQKLSAMFDCAVTAQSSVIEYRLSFYEKHTPAVSMRQPECGHAHARMGQGEIAHIHPSDGSMHMIFSVADARRVIDRGWGERHPLVGVRPRLPPTYIYVYPPRDDLELDVVRDLLAASIAHMTNRRGASSVASVVAT